MSDSEDDTDLSNFSVMTDDTGALCCPRCNCKLTISGGSGPLRADGTYKPSWYKVTVDLTRKRKPNGMGDPKTYAREYARRRRARLKALKATSAIP